MIAYALRHGVADRLRDDVRRRDPQPVEVRVGRAGRDRDDEIAVVAGVRRAARPGRCPRCPLCASRWHSALVQRASVASDHERRRLDRRRAPRGTAAVPAGAVDPARTRPSASTTSPTAFTTASAPIVAPRPGRSRTRGRQRTAWSGPAPLADGRAPTGTDATRRDESSSLRPRRPRRRALLGDRAFGAGHDEVVDRRAAGRSARAHRGSGTPGSCSTSHAITPSAVARPNAEPPLKTTASTCSTCGPVRAARSRASRARRRAPRPTDVPGGHSTTVTPVPEPVEWPTPGTRSASSPGASSGAVTPASEAGRHADLAPRSRRAGRRARRRARA